MYPIRNLDNSSLASIQHPYIALFDVQFTTYRDTGRRFALSHTNRHRLYTKFIMPTLTRARTNPIVLTRLPPMAC